MGPSMHGRANKWLGGRADWAVRASISRTMGRADGRTGWSGAEEPRSGGLGERADKRMGRRAGGPGFKRPHSTRPISLLGAQSACLVRA